MKHVRISFEAQVHYVTVDCSNIQESVEDSLGPTSGSATWGKDSTLHVKKVHSTLSSVVVQNNFWFFLLLHCCSLYRACSKSAVQLDSSWGRSSTESFCLLVWIQSDDPRGRFGFSRNASCIHFLSFLSVPINVSFLFASSSTSSMDQKPIICSDVSVGTLNWSA